MPIHDFSHFLGPLGYGPTVKNRTVWSRLEKPFEF